MFDFPLMPQVKFHVVDRIHPQNTVRSLIYWLEQFSIECRKTIESNHSSQSQKTHSGNTMNQSKLKAITCSRRKAWEIACTAVIIGFGFTSDWVKKWSKFFKPVVLQSKCKTNTLCSIDNKRHSPEVSDLQVSIPDMHLHVIPPKQVFPGNFTLGINMPIIRTRKKNLIASLPFREAALKFCLPWASLLFCFSWQTTHLGSWTLGNWKWKIIFLATKSSCPGHTDNPIFSSLISTLSTTITKISHPTLSRTMFAAQKFGILH